MKSGYRSAVYCRTATRATNRAGRTPSTSTPSSVSSGRPAAFLSAFFGALSLGGVLSADTIVKLNGTTIEDVKIIDARWDLVQYQVGGSGRAQSVRGGEIASIARAAGDRHLTSGRAAMKKGEYGEAIAELKDVSSTAEEWERAEAAYRLGEAYLESDALKEAEKQLESYLEKYEESKEWWVPAALYALGRTKVEMKQVRSAELTFEKLAEMPGQWPLRAQIGQARAIAASGNTSKYLQARQLLLSVARGRTTPVELKDEAYVLRGWIYVLQKQHREAIKELEEEFFDPLKTREYRYDARRAEATYLMGRAYLGLGGKENLEQAEIWLLRVPALYPNSGRVYGLSCRALATVYKELGNTERALEWARRARSAGGDVGDN